MQTVNFQCGSCNNLMGVSSEFLGQQVRCPHCQAVVVAPAAPTPAQPSPTEPIGFFPSFGNQQDDIFAPPEPTDDLFGDAESPRVELPPLAQEPALALNGEANIAPQPAASPFGSTTASSEPPASSVSTGTGAIPSWMDSPPAPAAGAAPSLATTPAEEMQEETIPHLVRRPRDGGGWFVGLVIIPLISYAILATIAVLVLWYRFQQSPPPPPNQLDTLPSFDPSDEEHSTHLKINQKVLNRPRSMDVKTATGPLLPERITRLGEKLEVGDLEIIPLKVDRQIVSVISKGSRPEPCSAPSLVLHLKLRNISSNVVFQPMDTFFDRKWMSKAEQPPLTILELLDPAHTVRFFGGPAEYHPPPRNNSGAMPPQEVEGARSSHVLRPGEEMDTFVCTDGDDKNAVDAVENYHGKLMWRVHLRRGIITVDAHHLAPVSSVVGIEFTDDDYRKSS
jgi:hypothetical protein